MPTSSLLTSKFLTSQRGFSLIEILVALVLAALIFLAVPSNEAAQKHRDLKGAIENLDRSAMFASNEAVLRNTVVRIRISLDANPVEYTVEYGPAGNLPLPEIKESTENLSLAEQKALQEKASFLDKQFQKVEEFEDIKQEMSGDVTINGVATSASKGIKKKGEANIYFYPTGEKDAAIIFLSTSEEMAYLEIAPFLTETKNVFSPFDTSSVAKLGDIIQTRMDEVYRDWGQ